jgi:hypothetical protein
MWACVGMVQAVGQDAAVQDTTMPPVTEHAVLTVEGRGVQIYSCMKTAKTAEWIFVAPAARLFDKDGVEVGTHGDGPVWHLEDGSSVLGKVIAKTPSPDVGSVGWLLLKAVSTAGTGTLADVEFVRRSETKGGVAPTTECDAGHLGEIVSVPYTATYAFYSAK